MLHSPVNLLKLIEQMNFILCKLYFKKSGVFKVLFASSAKYLSQVEGGSLGEPAPWPCSFLFSGKDT